MGYKNDIFEEQVDDELFCPICEKVLENPVQSVNCEHLFCQDCIQQWLKTNLICPSDFKPLLLSQLQQPPKIIPKLLNNLKIKCHFFDYGCLVKLRLSQLNSHLKVCLYNPILNKNVQISKTIESNDLKASSNEIKRFRMVGDLTNEINEMNRMVKELNYDLEYENRKSTEFSKNLEIAQLNYDNLNEKFKRIVNPFLDIFKNNYKNNIANPNENGKIDKFNCLEGRENLENEISCEQSAIVDVEHQICTAVIRNLDEFMNEHIIEEYLRQNGIYVLSCELELTVLRRSRDFKVTIYKSDFDKLFSEHLWPMGTTCHHLSPGKDNQIIFGKRQNDLPCVLIKSGLALSYY